MATPNFPITTKIESGPGIVRPKGKEHVIIVEPLLSPGLGSNSTPAIPTSIDQVRSNLELLKKDTPGRTLADYGVIDTKQAA